MSSCQAATSGRSIAGAVIASSTARRSGSSSSGTRRRASALRRGNDRSACCGRSGRTRCTAPPRRDRSPAARWPCRRSVAPPRSPHRDRRAAGPAQTDTDAGRSCRRAAGTPARPRPGSVGSGRSRCAPDWSSVISVNRFSLLSVQTNSTAWILRSRPGFGPKRAHEGSWPPGRPYPYRSNDSQTRGDGTCGGLCSSAA